MSLPSLIILLILFSLIAVYVDRRMESALDAKQGKPDAFTATGTTATQPAWFARFRRKKPLNFAQRFRTWSQHAFADQPDLQAWLNRMNDDSFAAFTHQVASFCLAFGVELEWLVDQQFNQVPALQQALTQTLMHYSRAQQTVLSVQEQLSVWKVYRDFDENPYGKTNQPFVQALFAKLVENQLTPTLAPDTFATSEVDRQIYRVQIIRQTADRQPIPFQQAVIAATIATRSAQVIENGTRKRGLWNRLFSSA